MLPRGVERIDKIKKVPDAFDRLYMAKRTLEYLVEPITRELRREDGKDIYLGDRLMHLEEQFADMTDLMFALGVRNKLDHPSAAQACPTDEEIGRAANYLVNAVDAILPHAPQELAVQIGYDPPRPKKRAKGKRKKKKKGNLCPECGKTFAHQSALNQHRMASHGVAVTKRAKRAIAKAKAAKANEKAARKPGILGRVKKLFG